MPRLFSYLPLVLLGLLAGVFTSAFAASGPKEWKGDNAGQGNASDNDKWLDGTKPGSSDTAKVSGGKMTVNESVTVAALEFTGGTIDGTQTLNALLAGSKWTGGTLESATLNLNGTTISAGGTKRLLASAKVNFGGATSWSGDNISTAGNVTITNAGTFTSSADGSITHDDIATNRGTFKNDGTFTKNSGVSEIQTKFDNNGSLNVGGGRLKLTGGGTSTGNVTIGGTVELGSNNYVFNGGALNGTGIIEITSATTTFAGTTGNAHVKVIGGNARFDGSTSTAGALTLASGKVEGTSSASVSTLTWTGGEITSATLGATNATIGAGATKSLKGNAKLNLSGATTWTGDNIITSGNATITNAGTFTSNADGSITHDDIATNRGTFKNDGTFTKNSGVSEIQTKFDNNGSLNVGGGRLKLSGGGASTGSISVGGTLELTSNTYTFDGATLNGTGNVELNGATTKFKGTHGNSKLVLTAGNAEFDTSASSAGKLTWSAGNVTSVNGGSAEFGDLDWSGGTLNGKIRSNQASLRGTNKTVGNGAELLLSGATSWDGSDIIVHGNGRIRNEADGTFTANADGVLTNAGSAVFTNHGSFVKSAGSGGATHVQAHFENNGSVTVTAGKLHLAGGGKNNAGGHINVAALAALEISNDLELSVGSSLLGGGLGRLINGTLKANGKIQLHQFDFDGGGLDGTNEFTGIVEWRGGHWNASQAGLSTLIAAGGVLNLRNSSSHDFNNRSIVNHGIVNWYAGNVRGGNGSAFVNHSIFNDLNGGNKRMSAPGTFGGSASFTNNGQYHKTHGGTTTVDIPFTNNGALSIAAGSIVFASGFSNNGQIHLSNGASAQFSQALHFGPASPLTGAGTINAPSVTAAGLVSPGTSPGAMTITGDLTLLSTSTLLIELGGPVQGTDYDFLNVGGTGLIAGTLAVHFANSYHSVLPATATFTILATNGGLTGAFNNVASGQRIFTTDGLGSFQVNYGLGSAFASNTVVLSNFVAVPEPSTWMMLGIGAVSVLFGLRRRRG